MFTIEIILNRLTNLVSRFVISRYSSNKLSRSTYSFNPELRHTHNFKLITAK